MSPIRIAGWIIWTAYVALAIAVAVFAYLVQSKRMDIGSTMASVLLLGVAGALARDPAARRIGPTVTIAAGWVGTIILAWFSWSFWTH